MVICSSGYYKINFAGEEPVWFTDKDKDCFHHDLGKILTTFNVMLAKSTKEMSKALDTYQLGI